VEVRDPVHGSIHILDAEIPIIRNKFFQRLRNIKQLGFSEYVFPGATHTRFLHSIGVMEIGKRAFERLFPNYQRNVDILRLKETFKLACLLHDIGHAPLSHSTETVMPPLEKLGIPREFLLPGDVDGKRKSTHEDYTIKSIIDGPFTESFKRVEDEFGVKGICIAELILGRTRNDSYFRVDGSNYFPILHQLVSSELDCDRMDYLLRDSYFCGVSYGNYDLDWLLDNLHPCLLDKSYYLGITERAVVTFDDFLLSRYHMFVMVYFHYRAVCLEQLLLRYFQTSPGEYSIPADIAKYIEHDDHYLMNILRGSTNSYARDIVQNRIPPKIYESFNEGQLEILEGIQEYLDSENIEYIRCSSSGRLSKYYSENAKADNFSFKVVRRLNCSDPENFSNIEEATDLFQKFSKSHAINRLHSDLKGLSHAQSSHIMNMIK